MQVTKLDAPIIICHEKNVELIINYCKDVNIVKWKRLYLFEAGSRISDLEQILSTIPNIEIRRYLDKFYFCICMTTPELQQEQLDDFFALIAEDYETRINIQGNTENIRNLFSLLKLLVGPLEGSTVLDYGCGTGLSFNLASEFKVNLIGFDRCDKMRQIAANRGMTVWGGEDLTHRNSVKFSGAFSSYVFHLWPLLDELAIVWGLLKPGGAFVANFHKNQGITYMNTYFEQLGASVRKLDALVDSTKHGEYIAYIKD